MTVRIFLALASARGWPIYQLDINNAFLHDQLHEEAYMIPPDGYTKMKNSQVCKLIKSLYGLKQASREWSYELSSQLQQFGFVQSENDNCLFVKNTKHSFTALFVYVDDVLVTGNGEQEIDAVNAFFDTKFTIKDLGVAKYFLGI